MHLRALLWALLARLVLSLPARVQMLRSRSSVMTRRVGNCGRQSMLSKVHCVPLRVPVCVNEEDITERFVKGSGRGGQKINKVSNCVVLVHLPTGLTVSCQDARDLSTNRKWARKLLVHKLDFHLNGSESNLGRKIAKIQKRKRDAVRKRRKRLEDDSTNLKDDSSTIHES